jgi:protein subunit release factor B
MIYKPDNEDEENTSHEAQEVQVQRRLRIQRAVVQSHNATKNRRTSHEATKPQRQKKLKLLAKNAKIAKPLFRHS